MLVLIAEIGDKMPTVAPTLAFGCAIAGLAFGLSRIHHGLVLLALPIVVFCDWALVSTLREPGFGDVVMSELGWGWIGGQLAGLNAPFILAIAAAFVFRSSSSRAKEAQCPN